MALTQFSSFIIADTGISMGDEGKGRLVYEVIEELKGTTGSEQPVAVVLKVNGGANSGHTAGGLKLNLLPAGVIDASVAHLALGMGVVADPRKLLWEAQPLEARGYRILERLLIDQRTMVSDLSHRLLDLAWEHYRVHTLAEEPRGSTGRGISPAFGDEVGQWQIFYDDFCSDKAIFAAKMRARMERACAVIKHVCKVSEDDWNAFFTTLTAAETRANAESINSGIFPASEFKFECFKGPDPFTLDQDAVIEAYWNAGHAVAKRIGDVREVVLQSIAEGRYIIGEFGQSFWLDKRHGFTPNVTASHTFTPEIFQSAGIPAQPVHTMGCCKAYDTKVGTHIFTTEIEESHPLSGRLKKLEFGTSTGRQRKVGWFDAVEKGDALRFGGFQDLVINKLDALSFDGNLKVCTAYQGPDGTLYHHVPRSDALRAKVTPVYTDLPGWNEDISTVRCYADLPANAQRYVTFCYQSMIAVATRQNNRIALPNLRYIGVGPDPAQIIKDVPTAEVLMGGGFKSPALS